MASFLISTAAPSGWSLDADDLRRRIAERYPGAQVRGPDSAADAYQLHWTIPTHSGIPLEGALDREGDGLVLDGDVDDAAEFAIWIRSQAPKGSALLFYDEGYTASVEVGPDTPAADLVTPFVDTG